MSKERELLQSVMEESWDFLYAGTHTEIKELLAQPEPEPSVKLPESEDEAVMMNLLSDNWLRHHAPHRLNQPEQGLREDLREGLREDLREGISLRDHFAGLAMQEFIALNNFKASLIVSMSYEMADLMLVERERKE